MPDSNPLLSFLRECVVHVEAGGDFQGTGFFVAPGQVLTCAHVVHGLDRISVGGRGWSAAAEVEAVRPELEPDAAEASFYPPPDVALLRVPDAPASHPCVRLEEALPASGPNADVLHLFGYSRDEYGPGEVRASPAAVDFKGAIENEMLKLGSDQVLPGYSGCPALNLRTGSVCAMVDSTRDPNSDLGGFGVPLAMIEAALPGLLAANAAHQAGDERWARAREDEEIAARERGDPARLPLTAPLAELDWNTELAQSELLKPRFGIVGLVGREALQDQLMSWRESDAALRVVMITGGGGFGKTRLALEECGRAGRAGWTSGLFALDASADPDRALDRLAAWPGRLFVAIDYAETRPALVSSLILRLAARRGGPPVRLILVCRQAQTRAEIEDIFAVGDGSDEVLRVLGQGEPVRLDRHPIDSQLLFGNGVAAFAARLGTEVAPVPRPSLREAHFSRPLFVLAAALLVALDPRVDIDSMSQEQVMLELLDRHEARYWQRLSDDLGADLDPVVQRRAVAVATVLGANSEEEATRLVAIVPGLEDASSERRRAVARWLSRLYSDGRLDRPPAIAPVEPDMLAEALVSREFTAEEKLLDASLDVASDEQLTRALTVLSRACASSEQLRGLLRDALDERLPALIGRLEGGTDLAAALELAVLAVGPLVGAARVVGETAGQLGSLGSLELTLHVLEAAYFRALEKQGGVPESRRGLGRSLSNLSVLLSEGGRFPEALTSAEEAVAIYRELAAADREAHLSELTTALAGLSNRLMEAGRFEDALEVSEEALRERRALAAVDAASHLPELALTLNNISTLVGRLGRRREALEFGAETVAIWRRLVGEGKNGNRPDLAMALNNFSVVHAELGEYEEALAAAAEAVEIRRQLVAEDVGHQSDLALALSNMSAVLGNLGREESSLEMIEEAVGYYRLLVEGDPLKYTRDLASALGNLSNRLNGLGRGEESLVAGQETVSTYELLARRDAVENLPYLALSLGNLAVVLDDLGRGEEALHACRRAVALHRALAAQYPARHRPDLADALNTLSAIFGKLERIHEALGAAGEAVECYRELLEEEPARYRPDLAMALNNLSIILGRVEREDDGLAAIEESSDHYRLLYRDNAARYRPNLAASLGNLANRLRRAGRGAEALTAIEESVALLRDLITRNAARFEPDLAGALVALSTCLADLEREEEALAAISESVSRFRNLARGSAIYLLDMSKALENLARISKAAGRQDEALAAIEAAVAEHSDSPQGGSLLLVRAMWHWDAGEPEPAVSSAWEGLQRLLPLEEGVLLTQARALLRTLKSADSEAFDPAWEAAVGEEQPVWLRFPATEKELTSLLVEWLKTPDWGQSHSFLEEHAEVLLSDRGEAGLEHLRDVNMGRPEINQHREIIAAARANGVDAVYRQLAQSFARANRSERLRAWLAIGNPKEGVEFLEQNAGDLLLPETAEELLEIALRDPTSTVALGRLGLLGLARIEGVADAYESLEGLEKLSDEVCLGAAEEPRTLAVARIFGGASGDDPEAQFRHALAATAVGSDDEAAQAMVRCRRQLPTWEVPDYRRRLDGLAQAQRDLGPRLERLAQALEAAPEIEEEAGGD
jgi:tetratricopeptide (TPR) repeat protein